MPAFEPEGGTAAEAFMPETFPPNLILQDTSRGDFLAGVTRNFMLLDGTRLPRRDALALLTTVPGNERLVAHVRAGRIWNLILLGVGLAATTTQLVFALADLPDPHDIVFPLTFSVNLLSLSASAFISQTANRRFLRAVDNYNLHQLRIPLPMSRN